MCLICHLAKPMLAFEVINPHGNIDHTVVLVL